MSRNIAILGHFGGEEYYTDGQTVKTKVLFDSLKDRYGNQLIIDKIDTYYIRRRPLKFFKDLFMSLVKCNSVIVLLSRNGMKVLFPILYVFKKCFNKTIFHDVIGGNLGSIVQDNKIIYRCISAFDVNWVETESMKEELAKLGIRNCEVLPNFKVLNYVKAQDYSFDKFKFCTFSRVMKEKGIEEAINVINSLNKQYGREVCTLDIYGAIDEGYREKFKLLLAEIPSFINYKGIVDFDKSVAILKDYYALLFPTFWHGEGFPGTILDAYAAAIPVIASDWNCNSELVKHLKTGIIYPNDKFLNLEESVKWAIEHREDINNMRVNCEVEYKQYTPQNTLKIIEAKLLGK